MFLYYNSEPTLSVSNCPSFIKSHLSHCFKSVSVQGTYSVLVLRSCLSLPSAVSNDHFLCFMSSWSQVKVEQWHKWWWCVPPVRKRFYQLLCQPSLRQRRYLTLITPLMSTQIAAAITHRDYNHLLGWRWKQIQCNILMWVGGGRSVCDLHCGFLMRISGLSVIDSRL